jgi:hypothetical protein
LQTGIPAHVDSSGLVAGQALAQVQVGFSSRYLIPVALVAAAGWELTGYKIRLLRACWRVRSRACARLGDNAAEIHRGSNDCDAADDPDRISGGRPALRGQTENAGATGSRRIAGSVGGNCDRMNARNLVPDRRLFRAEVGSGNDVDNATRWNWHRWPLVAGLTVVVGRGRLEGRDR